MRSKWTWTLLALVWAGQVAAHEGSPSRYNYKRHLRPIFVTHCGGCHHAGGVGPMSLLDYQSAVPWANAIKMQVLGEQMPPWLPVDGIGSFQHARSLSPEEVDMIVDWVVGLTPEGDPLTAAELEASTFSGGWQMEEPDLVLAPADAIVIGEDDYELTECLVLPTGLDGPRTVSELEVKPGLPTLVRRATIGLGDSCASAKLLATWLPGQGSVALAHVLPKGAHLAVEILYVKGWEDEGKRFTDRSEIGLRFEDGVTPVQSMRVSSSIHAFDEDIELVALFPDPVDVNGPLRIEAVTPDGVVEPILVIERFAAQWREKYVLTDPLRLPSGSELRLSQPAAWIEFIPVSRSSAE